ncbi:hypothetical protein [Xanthobacter tagetidis]|uniref:Uncharacterized protein n=1 Tax=Xanthobacter tagetidis TaxID=60216 RepID=A0A3L7AGP5_9HYPH|nr:hypothetical protein [Xanthobacter tagetidis]MBB6306285.1 hypothetical protein [Xanthobacter tagetidis]RLP79559.1 hypothetical protein D9R14_07805 [Xanthobacter tagetidis]
MQKTEQRAFAAVWTGGKRDVIVAGTVRGLASEARAAAAAYWSGGWPEAKRRGWRIRPVLIRVEDETQETGHDR